MQLVLLGSGSTGNCALVEAGRGDDRVLVVLDCGLAQRTARDLAQDAQLSLTQIDAVLLTHAHADHSGNVVGVAGRAKVPLYAHSDTIGQRPQLRASELVRRKVEHCPYESNKPFSIGPLTVTPIKLPHDAEPTHGFLFEDEQGRRAGYFSDLGRPEVLCDGVLDGLESLVLEFNYDREMLLNGPYPPHLVARISGGLGHLSNEESARILREACPNTLKHLTLAHLSRHNNRPKLAAEAARAALSDAGRSDLEPKVAPPQGATFAGPVKPAARSTG